MVAEDDEAEEEDAVCCDDGAILAKIPVCVCRCHCSLARLISLSTQE
jgi:hypothetical protein